MANTGRSHLRKKQVPWNKGLSNSTTKRCAAIARKALSKKEPWNKGGKPYCSDCGNRVRSYYAKICRECRQRKAVGPNSANWKGGVTSKDRLERLRFRRQIQKTVFERDDYTCQICGARGVNLQVDHIQSWAEYVELRFNIENCRTLCANCHYKITFGKPMPPAVRAWGHNLLKVREEL